MGARGLVSAVVLAVAAALFVPVFFEAAAGIELGSWAYAAEADLILSNIPVVLAAGVLLVLVTAMEAQLQ